MDIVPIGKEIKYGTIGLGITLTLLWDTVIGIIGTKLIGVIVTIIRITTTGKTLMVGIIGTTILIIIEEVP